MIIITEKETNAVLNWSETADYMSNGYPRLIEKNIAYVSEMVNVCEAESVPEEVEPVKYCYTAEEGFFPNPNYKEPDPFDSPEYAAGYEQALLDLMELELEEEE